MPVFTHRFKVRFHEVDRAAIVFFGRYFEYCNVAVEELFEAAGLSIAGKFKDDGWAMPLVHAECDFKKPLRHGEEIAVEVALERLGENSFTLAFRFLGAGTAAGSGSSGEDLRATAKLVHASIQLPGFTKRPVPEAVKDGLRRVGLLQ